MRTVHHQGLVVVVVGVDGSPASQVALEYAVTAAARRRLTLVVVHGFAPPMGGVWLTEEVLATTRRGAQRLVDEAVSRVAMAPSVRVETLVEPASPVQLLRHLSAEARLVVVGQHRFRLLDELVAGAVASPLAATTSCPVVVVPSRRSGSGLSSPEGGVGRPIVVALDGETAARAVLGFAFEEAELTGTAVVALHASPLHHLRSSASEERSKIGAILAGPKQDHPDVAVSTMIVPGEPGERIVDASLSAALVVVGRPHQEHGWGHWTRSVARSVIDRSACPLAVVPQPHQRQADDDPSRAPARSCRGALDTGSRTAR